MSAVGSDMRAGWRPACGAMGGKEPQSITGCPHERARRTFPGSLVDASLECRMATARSQRPHRDFLNIGDFSPAETFALLALAERMRAGAYDARPLAGKALAMIFMKSSTRTRVSFEVGATQLGGTAHFLSPRDVQIGRGEPIADTARVLDRYVHGIMIRTFAHADAVTLAEYAGVPVINGLTDLSHPCQVLADVLTMRQHLGEIRGRTVAWIGDGNNMANSWIEAAAHLGFALRLACPEGYDPDAGMLADARAKGGDVTIVRDPMAAASGADVVTTDVWASMGQEEEQVLRVRAFAGYQVDETMMARAARHAIFLHCLPAHRGEEVSAGVIDGPQSVVWDEAENRLHIQKAIMAALMGGESLSTP
jgi:ornithine carbamoyltransferase